jgi:hypothetical protein
MRARILQLAIGFSAGGALAQVTIKAPGLPRQGNTTRESDANYGAPRVVELDQIALGDTYHRKHVITEGEVSKFMPGRYWTVRAGGALVLLIPGRNFAASDLDRVDGKRTEVRGVVRVWGKLNSIDNDPTLPPMPREEKTNDQSMPVDMPNVTITVFEIRDRTDTDSFRRSESSQSQRILDEPSAWSGKTTRIHGQFRGRNLFGDLPPESARDKDNWVLKDGDTSMWVMGKAPKGDGWKLDIDYRGDAKNWLDVEGKPEVVNGVLYLRASKVTIAKAPGSTKATSPKQ